MLALVTVKLPRNPDHNPADKKTATCPVNGYLCTDVTGEHHTIPVNVDSIEQAEAYVRRRFSGVHITRTEALPWAHEGKC